MTRGASTHSPSLHPSIPLSRPRSIRPFHTGSPFFQSCFPYPPLLFLIHHTNHELLLETSRETIHHIQMNCLNLKAPSRSSSRELPQILYFCAGHQRLQRKVLFGNVSCDVSPSPSRNKVTTIVYIQHRSFTKRFRAIFIHAVLCTTTIPHFPP